MWFSEVLHPYVAFAADDVTRVIGVMRLRQQRVRREPCERNDIETDEETITNRYRNWKIGVVSMSFRH